MCTLYTIYYVWDFSILNASTYASYILCDHVIDYGKKSAQSLELLNLNNLPNEKHLDLSIILGKKYVYVCMPCMCVHVV